MLKSLPAFLLDLVFPPFCQGCLAEGTYLCLACQSRIEPPIHRCLYCNKNSPLGQTHNECSNRNTLLAGLIVAAEYKETAVRNLIWQLKYNSIKNAGESLALILADFFVKNDILDFFAESIVVPVPIDRRRRLERGFNQAEIIAAKFGQKIGLKYQPALKKIKKTKPQAKLRKEERLKNMDGAFGVRNELRNQLRNKTVILLDDVATTGATLAACAEALREAEPQEIWGLVVARN